MNIIQKYKIDFEKIKPILIEAFSNVYGEHNRKIIEERINKIELVQYIRKKDLSIRYSDELKQFKIKLFFNLIKKISPNLDVQTDTQLIKLYKDNPDLYKRICLLLGEDKIHYMYKYPDHESDFVSYRMPEIFDEERYSNLTDYGKQVIDKKRVEIINGFGLNITMEEYLESLRKKSFKKYIEKFQQYIDIIEQLDLEYIKFLEEHKEIIDFLNTNNYNDDITYQECKEQIKSINLLTNDGVTFDYIKYGGTCCIPGLSVKNGKRDLTCLILFPIMESAYGGKRDLTFIHEIQHAIETQLIDINEDYSVFKSGFDTVNEEWIGKPDMSNKGNEHRRYELMSESIHQQIAKEVTQYIHDRNIYFFGNNPSDNDPDLKKTCPYDDLFSIIEPFYLKYKKEILDARLSYSEFIKLMKTDIKQILDSINELVNEADKLSSIFGIDQNSEEYLTLVKKSNELVEKSGKNQTSEEVSR